MPLAGNMKQSTFLTLIGCVGALGVAGFFLFRGEERPEPEPVLPVVQQPVLAERIEDPVPPKVSIDGDVRLQEGVQNAQQEGIAAELPNMDPVDVALFKWQGKDLGTQKIKDTTQGKPFKINVYQDAGNSTANRAKIDLDRDDQWDIKVTFQDPPSRQLSPSDDENYTQTQLWTGQAWE